MNVLRKMVTFATLIIVNAVVHAQVLYISEDDLAKNAYDIVEGTVANIESQWNGDHNLIYSYITLAVDTAYKKMVNESEIVISVIGGKLDGFVTSAPNVPEYVEGEEVLVFLQREGSGYRTYGLDQGKFSKKIVNGATVLQRKVDMGDFLILDSSVGSDEIKLDYQLDELRNTIITNIQESKEK